jgi:hypothetical protein
MSLRRPAQPLETEAIDPLVALVGSLIASLAMGIVGCAEGASSPVGSGGSGEGAGNPGFGGSTSEGGATGQGGTGATSTSTSSASSTTSSSTSSSSSGGGPVCGNSICEAGESCADCQFDCGSCCGNGLCDNGETQSTCPADCGSLVACHDPCIQGAALDLLTCVLGEFNLCAADVCGTTGLEYCCDSTSGTWNAACVSAAQGSFLCGFCIF